MTAIHEPPIVVADDEDFAPDEVATPEERSARRRELLRAVFCRRKAAELFAVLRNDDALPDALSGNDLDLAVVHTGAVPAVVDYIQECGRELGWAPVCVSRRAHMTALSLVDLATAGSSDALHVDVFDGLRALGVPLLTAEELAAESVVDASGVRRLTERGRALATLVHHLANSGGLTKDKYVWEVADVLRRPDARAWLIAETGRVLGPRVAAALQAREGRSALRRCSVARLLGVRAHALRRAPAAGARAMRDYMAGQLPSLFAPPGLVGRPGSPAPLLDGVAMTPELACRIAPVSFLASTVRAPEAHTLNGAKHQRYVTGVWRRWTLARWLAPSLFLWLQAKRSRVVLIDRLPLVLRALRRLREPAWLLPDPEDA
jgi:hypothetical protein